MTWYLHSAPRVGLQRGGSRAKLDWPAKKRRMCNPPAPPPPAPRKKSNEGERKGGRRENAEKRAVDSAGYSWKEDPPGDDTGGGTAREHPCECVRPLARSRSTCVRPLTLRSPRATMPNHRIRRIRKTDRSAAGISARPPPPNPPLLYVRVCADVRAWPL